MKIILTEDQIKFIVNEQTPQAPSRLNSIGIERVVKTYNNPISDGYNYRLVKTYSNPLSNVVNDKYGSNNQNYGRFWYQRLNRTNSLAYRNATESWGGDNSTYPFIINVDTINKLNRKLFPQSSGLKIDPRLLPQQSDTIDQKYEKQPSYVKVPYVSNWNWHDAATILQVAALFVPVVGPLLSVGIGAADAAVYYSEGRNGEAALSMMLLALPGVSKIPGVKDIGKETIKSIVSKIGTSKALTKLESSTIGKIAKNAKSLRGELTNFISQSTSKPAVQQSIKAGKSEVLKKVKDNIKSNVFGQYGGFITRPKMGLTDNIVKYTKPYLKSLKSRYGAPVSLTSLNSVIKSSVDNKYLYTKNGTDVYWTKAKENTPWTKFSPSHNTKVTSAWDKLPVVTS
jgi:hypothetical protein